MRRESLRTLPLEIHLDIIRLVKNDRYFVRLAGLSDLGSVDRYWRAICFRFIFEKVHIGERSNAAIADFISNAAPVIGQLVKRVHFEDVVPKKAHQIDRPDRPMCSCCEDYDILEPWDAAREALVLRLFSLLPNLRVLRLSFPDSYRNLDVPSIKTRFTTLMQMLDQFPALREIRLCRSRAAELLSVIQLPPTVTYLVVDLGGSGEPDTKSKAIPQHWWQVALSSNLTHLDLCHFPVLTSNSIRTLTNYTAEGFPTCRLRLQELSILNLEPDVQSMATLLKAFGGPTLRTCTLSFSSSFDSPPTPPSALHFPQLTSLTIENLEPDSAQFWIYISFFSHPNNSIRTLDIISGELQRKDFQSFIARSPFRNLEVFRYDEISDDGSPWNEDVLGGRPNSGSSNWTETDARYAQELAATHDIRFEVDYSGR